MQIGLCEFLTKVSKLKRTQEKIDALKANDSLPLRIILQCAFDPNVKFILPEGEPPYKPNELLDQQHILVKECEKLRYFVQGFHDMLPQAKREMMFVEMLERVDPEDAKLMVAIKDKKLPMKGITIDHVTQALPGLIPSLEKKEVNEQVSTEEVS